MKDFNKLVKIFVIGIIIGFGIVYVVLLFKWRCNYRNDVKQSVNFNDENEILYKENDFLQYNKGFSLVNGTIKILCFLTAKRDEIETINMTWGKKCDVLLYSELGPKQSIVHIHKNYLHVADWFIKANLQTFVVIENLKKFLTGRKSSEPTFYGTAGRTKHLRPFKNNLMYGDPGYVLSRGAIERLAEEGFRLNIFAAANDWDEDVDVSGTATEVGVGFGDTRDSFGRMTFIPVKLVNALNPLVTPNDEVNWRERIYKQSNGLECCSTSAIAFSNVENLLFFDCMIYKFKIFNTKRKKELERL